MDKNCCKGPITGWRIENLAGIDYEVLYRPVPPNGIPDTLSRHSFLGPRQLTRVGTGNALLFLLEVLSRKLKQHDSIWFGTARDTLALIKIVKEWRGGGAHNLTRVPKSEASDNL